MGNYYSGYISFSVTNKIPIELVSDFLKIRNYYDIFQNKPFKKDVFSKYLVESGFFEYEDFGCITIDHLYVMYRNKEMDTYIKLMPNDDRVTEFPSSIESNGINYDFYSAYISININTKHFFTRTKNPDNLIDLLYNLLYPYIDFDRDNYEENDNPRSYCIGKIEDEDGTYSKYYYPIKGRYERLKELRGKGFCEGCELFEINAFCENYEFCKRAYNIGMNEKRPDNE